MDRWPDFLVAGAPEGGTTLLHAALATHPELRMSRTREPGYFLGDGTPPRREAHRGPGDAHARLERVWRSGDYLRLWDPAPGEALLGESTPYYLADRAAHRRIARDLPAARIVLVLRDPADRAYASWLRLWNQGLEPVPDLLEALTVEPTRRADGWAARWAYRALGAYGAQLDHLLRHVDRERVLVVRYRHLVEQPEQTLSGVAHFLEVEPVRLHIVQLDGEPGFRPDTVATRTLARGVRAGAAAGAWGPAALWRVARAPMTSRLHGGGAPPALTAEQRREILTPMLADVELLESLTGMSFDDWRARAGLPTTRPLSADDLAQGQSALG